MSIYVHVSCRGCGGAQRTGCKSHYLFTSWVLGMPLRSSSGLVAGSFPTELSHPPDIVFFQFLISFSFLPVVLLQHSWKPPCCMRFITLQSIMQAWEFKTLTFLLYPKKMRIILLKITCLLFNIETTKKGVWKRNGDSHAYLLYGPLLWYSCFSKCAISVFRGYFSTGINLLGRSLELFIDNCQNIHILVCVEYKYVYQ